MDFSYAYPFICIQYSCMVIDWPDYATRCSDIEIAFDVDWRWNKSLVRKSLIEILYAKNPIQLYKYILVLVVKTKRMLFFSPYGTSGKWLKVKKGIIFWVLVTLYKVFILRLVVLCLLSSFYYILCFNFCFLSTLFFNFPQASAPAKKRGVH